jgi:tetratricopeptide (TPR) repeat protein
VIPPGQPKGESQTAKPEGGAVGSRLLRQLDAAIAAAASPIDAGCLCAQRAALLARRGQKAEARAQLDDLRQRFARTPHPAVTAWLCLAEGLADYFADLSASSRDRLQRAHALAAAARIRPLQALAAAWLANTHYARSEDAQMARMLAEALQLAAADHHAARARACLVAARAYHLAGRHDAARGFYARSREHAAAEGDEATVSAIMYDMAGLWVHQAQLAELFEGGRGADARQALLSAESLVAFDRGTGMLAQQAVDAMVRAQALAMQGRFDAALALYEEHLDAALAQGVGHREAPLRADMAWCLQQMGRGDAARTTARDAEAALLGHVDVDDRAMAHARLARVFEALGMRDAAQQHGREAQLRWTDWQAQRQELLRLLDDALGTPADAAGHRPAASST